MFDLSDLILFALVSSGVVAVLTYRYCQDNQYDQEEEVIGIEVPCDPYQLGNNLIKALDYGVERYTIESQDGQVTFVHTPNDKRQELENLLN